MPRTALSASAIAFRTEDPRSQPFVGRKLLHGERLQLRAAQHLLEPSRGYMQLPECLLAGDTDFAAEFNFGPREAADLHHRFRTAYPLFAERRAPRRCARIMATFPR